jgi:phosphatidylglycerol:prolipoprotein diacylglycerol transferase
LDILAPGLALGQAIGRWGNFFNQELYGAPTHLPWAIYIDPQHRLPGFENQAYYHPTFLYESIWDLGNMALLLWLARRFKDRFKSGDIFLVYLIVYAVGRFMLEFLRLDSSQLGGINDNQAFMAVVFIIASLALVWRHWLGPKTGLFSVAQQPQAGSQNEPGSDLPGDDRSIPAEGPQK